MTLPFFCGAYGNTTKANFKHGAKQASRDIPCKECLACIPKEARIHVICLQGHFSACPRGPCGFIVDIQGPQADSRVTTSGQRYILHTYMDPVGYSA